MTLLSHRVANNINDPENRRAGVHSTPDNVQLRNTKVRPPTVNSEESTNRRQLRNDVPDLELDPHTDIRDKDMSLATQLRRPVAWSISRCFRGS